MLGLNARLLITSVLAIAICVPLYIFGQDYILEGMSRKEVQRQICEIMSESRGLSSMKREEVIDIEQK